RGSSRRASVPSASPSPNPSSKLQISPMAIAFGNQPLNGSAIRSVTVTNTNSETITLDESLLSGSMAFTLEGDTCTNTVLAPGDRCTLDLGFRTDTPGQQEAALIIGDNSSSHVQRVVLQGTGVTDLAPDTDNSPSNPSGNRPTNNPNPGTTRSPEIKGFNASPATGLQPTDTTRLCYEIDQATQAYLVNETTGERITLPNASAGCVTQTPGRNTTYTLVAMNQTSQEVRRGLDVVVAQPDWEPPMTPRAIAPTGGDTVYCTNSANLTWSAATDNNGPVSYTVTLQRWEAASANDEEEAILVSGTWVNVQTMTTAGTQLNLSGLIMPPFTYRWQVKAIDAAGNVSQPSAWAQFWCIAP
ncbi:MAG: choice-of-anchor D domain-containing protein, partial [Leptolyngbyaceae bacterium]|nr:choice-of-anchor D domain-containing protein [Leptolyngbyaceae bacterium]